MNTKEIKELGFKKVADKVEAEQELNRKLSTAYLNFKICKEEHIKAFNEKLKTRTLKTEGTQGHNLTEHYEKLVEIKVEDYDALPPENVLEAMKKAKALNCFDSFEIAKIESVKEYKDPILFGRIHGCTDRFYIAEWDNDIKIQDLIGE